MNHVTLNIVLYKQFPTIEAARAGAELIKNRLQGHPDIKMLGSITEKIEEEAEPS